MSAPTLILLNKSTGKESVNNELVVTVGGSGLGFVTLYTNDPVIYDLALDDLVYSGKFGKVSALSHYENPFSGWISPNNLYLYFDADPNVKGTEVVKIPPGSFFNADGIPNKETFTIIFEVDTLVSTNPDGGRVYRGTSSPDTFYYTSHPDGEKATTSFYGLGGNDSFYGSSDIKSVVAYQGASKDFVIHRESGAGPNPGVWTPILRVQDKTGAEGLDWLLGWANLRFDKDGVSVRPSFDVINSTSADVGDSFNFSSTRLNEFFENSPGDKDTVSFLGPIQNYSIERVTLEDPNASFWAELGLPPSPPQYGLRITDATSVDGIDEVDFTIEFLRFADGVTLKTDDPAVIRKSSTNIQKAIPENLSKTPAAITGNVVNVIVDLFGNVLYLKDLIEVKNEKEHSINYEGVSFQYDEIAAFVMVAVRNGEFTKEFRAELAEVYPTTASISYSTVVKLLGQDATDSAVLYVAGFDGNYVG